jgi:hypothetical protein
VVGEGSSEDVLPLPGGQDARPGGQGSGSLALAGGAIARAAAGGHLRQRGGGGGGAGGGAYEYYGEDGEGGADYWEEDQGVEWAEGAQGLAQGAQGTQGAQGGGLAQGVVSKAGLKFAHVEDDPAGMRGVQRLAVREDLAEGVMVAELTLAEKALVGRVETQFVVGRGAVGTVACGGRCVPYAVSTTPSMVVARFDLLVASDPAEVARALWEEVGEVMRAGNETSFGGQTGVSLTSALAMESAKEQEQNGSATYGRAHRARAGGGSGSGSGSGSGRSGLVGGHGLLSQVDNKARKTRRSKRSAQQLALYK